MAKKAIKRPDEVEYIEFKGRENFKEVCEFIRSTGELVTKLNGTEIFKLHQYKFDENVIIPVGAIFYKWINYGNDENIYGPESWDVMDKDEFFRRYKEDDQ